VADLVVAGLSLASFDAKRKRRRNHHRFRRNKMPKIVITKCECVANNGMHKDFRVEGTIDGDIFAVSVLPWCSEYDYETLPDRLVDGRDFDDEEIQVAIGQHFVDTDTDVGLVGR
jgi:hypothetical protein